jgi:hypothetical protein
MLPSGTSIIYAGNMGDFATDVEIAATALHEWMPSVTHNPVENEFLVLWHTTGVREEGGENMYSLHGRRVDPDGQFVGSLLAPIKSIGPERRILPRAAYNTFTGNYMVAFIMGQEITEWDPFITIINSAGDTVYEPFSIAENLTKANHPSIAFNSKRRQYLVTYNDSRNGNADVFGVILAEDGSIVKEDFPIDTSTGDQINSFACYNPANDNFLVNWEDFRNVTEWMQSSDIYGAIIDADGTLSADSIPLCDDHGKENEGDQRHNNIAYNPDKNEFLVSWTDTRPSLFNVGVAGRFVKADGTMPGPDFTVVDGIGSQIFPHAVYVEKRKQYFVIWDDSRAEPNTNWREVKERDVYARWITSAGKPIGADISICTKAGSQRYSDVAYNPLMDRFLITWRDEVDEEVLVPGGSGHIVESGGNVMGKVYGMPSFLTCRILEKGAGIPVDDVKVLIIGPSLPKIRNTNNGGWFNIAKGNQRKGSYSVFAYKAGYRIGIQSVVYTGVPLHSTVELTKR